MQKCNRCGHINKDGAAFCAGCGQKLGDSRDISDRQEVSAQKTETVQEHTTAYNSSKDKRRLRGAQVIAAALAALAALGVMGSWYFYQDADDLKKQLEAAQTEMEELTEGYTSIVRQGSASPEEAVELYLQAFKEGDFKKALSYCNTEAYADRFSYQKYYEGELADAIASLPQEDLWLAGLAPTEYAAYKMTVEISLDNDRARELGCMAYSLLDKSRLTAAMEEIDEIIYNYNSSIKDDFNIEDDYMDFTEDREEAYAKLTDIDGGASMVSDFISNVDPAGLAALEIVKIMSLEQENKEAAEADEAFYNKYGYRPFFADQNRFILAVFQLDGQMYRQIYNVSEYDGSWYISSDVSSSYSEAVPISEEEYSELLADSASVGD